MNSWNTLWPWMLATLFACLLGAALCTSACTHAQGDAALRLLSMTAEACAKVALQQGRRDVALACGVTDSALDVLQASLDSQQCTIPSDAGGQ